MFPPKCKIEHLETVSVLHPENGTVDHWLSRFGINLVWTEDLRARNRHAPVLFSTVELRYTFKAEIIGLNIRWRPFEKVLRSKQIEMPHDDHSSHDHHHEKDEAPIVYTLDTIEAPAMVLGPYYYIAGEGHHAGFEPASKYSLVVDIFQENLKDGANLYPMIKGGSGEFEFHWGKWQIDEVTEQGILYLGQSSRIDVSLGVYNIIIDVLDKETQLVKRFEKMIYAKGLEEEQESLNISA